MKNFLLVILLLTSTLCFAQMKIQINMQKLDSANGVFDTVEQMPKFPGGDIALQNFIKKHLRYPKAAKKKGTEEKVYITFVVNEDGTLDNPFLFFRPPDSFGDETIRLVNNMPKWIPGKKDGKTVKVRYFLPVWFKLNSN
jgi:periplasmic protein TonB